MKSTQETKHTKISEIRKIYQTSFATHYIEKCDDSYKVSLQNGKDIFLVNEKNMSIFYCGYTFSDVPWLIKFFQKARKKWEQDKLQHERAEEERKQYARHRNQISFHGRGII